MKEENIEDKRVFVKYIFKTKAATLDQQMYTNMCGKTFVCPFSIISTFKKNRKIYIFVKFFVV